MLFSQILTLRCLRAALWHIRSALLGADRGLLAILFGLLDVSHLLNRLLRLDIVGSAVDLNVGRCRVFRGRPCGALDQVKHDLVSF